MFRKTALALGAAIALSAAALSSTAASAAPHGGHGWHGGHGGWHGGFHHGFRGYRRFGVGFYGPAYVVDDCYVVRRGHRLIQVCN